MMAIEQELVEVEIRVEGQDPVTKSMPLEDAKKACMLEVNGICVSPNSAGRCNLTATGCRRGKPLLEPQ